MSSCAVVETRIRKLDEFVEIAKMLKTLVVYDNEDGSFTTGPAKVEGSFFGVIKFFCSPDFVDKVFDSLPGLIVHGSVEIYPVKDC